MAKEAYILQTGKPPTHEAGDKLAQAIKRSFLTVPNRGRMERSGIELSASAGDFQRVRVALRERYGEEPTEAQVRAGVTSIYQGRGTTNAR